MPAEAQQRANARMWARTDLVHRYANRSLRPVEATLLLRYREALSGPVLELGCGAGRLTGYLAELAVEVDALDVSASMVAACKEAYPSVRVSEGDLRDLSAYADGHYGAVVAGYSVIDVLDDADRRAVFADVRRLLAPGGLFVFSTHNRDVAPDSPAQRLRSGPREAVKLLLGIPRWWQNRRQLTKGERQEPGYAILNDSSHDYGALHYYITAEAQRRQLADCGFSVVECLEVDGTAVAAGARPRSAELHFVAR